MAVLTESETKARHVGHGAQGCNPSAQEAEAGGLLPVRGVHGELKASLNHVARPCLKQNRTKQAAVFGMLITDAKFALCLKITNSIC